MTPRLSLQISILGVLFILSKSPLKIERQKKLAEKITILTRNPQRHVLILIYRTWPIEGFLCLNKKGGCSLHYE